MTKKKDEEQKEEEVEEDERDGRGRLGGGSPIRAEYGWGRTPLPSPARYLRAALHNPPGPRNAPEPALPLSRTTTIHPPLSTPVASTPPSPPPTSPSFLRNPRGSSWRLPKTSARERFSRHERGSLRTTDGEDIHGRENLHGDFRAYATLKPFTHATRERTYERTHAMPVAAGNGCTHPLIRPRSPRRCD